MIWSSSGAGRWGNEHRPMAVGVWFRQTMLVNVLHCLSCKSQAGKPWRNLGSRRWPNEENRVEEVDGLRNCWRRPIAGKTTANKSVWLASVASSATGTFRCWVDSEITRPEPNCRRPRWMSTATNSMARRRPRDEKAGWTKPTVESNSTRNWWTTFLLVATWITCDIL